MLVHAIIERTSIDYCGSSDEILDIFGDIEIAKNEAIKLYNENYNVDIEYYVESFELKV